MQDGFLRAAAASIPVAVADPRRNAAAICARIDQAHRAHAALLVLPELCEDVWAPVPPSVRLCLAGATVIANCSASPEAAGKPAHRRTLLRAASARGLCGYVYANAGPDESTAHAVFSAHHLIAENGTILAEHAPFAPESGLLMTELDLLTLTAERRRNTTFVPEGEGMRAVTFSMPLRPTPLGRAVSPHPFVPDDAEQRFKRAGLLLTMQAHGLRKRLLHTGSRAALLPVTDDSDSVLALLVCARTMDLLGRARHDVLAVTQPEGDRARVLRLCKALGVSVRPNADHAGLARTHAALPLAAADFTALLLGEAVCAPDAYGVNAAVPRTLVRWLIAAEAERAEEPLRTELRAALSAPDADCAGVSCALTDFCFYHLVRCGAHPRRILRLARAAFGGADADADILRAMAALTCCLFQRPAALPDHVTLGSGTQALRWPPDAAGSLWLDEIDALRRELP